MYRRSKRIGEEEAGLGLQQDMAQHCAVSKCSNGKYKILQWAQELCDIHKCKKGDKGCSCDIGFKLFPFPTVKKNKHLRDQWKKMINRGNPKKNRQLWSPSREVSFFTRRGGS